MWWVIFIEGFYFGGRGDKALIHALAITASTNFMHYCNCYTTRFGHPVTCFFWLHGRKVLIRALLIPALTKFLHFLDFYTTMLMDQLVLFILFLCARSTDMCVSNISFEKFPAYLRFQHPLKFFFSCVQTCS